MISLTVSQLFVVLLVGNLFGRLVSLAVSDIVDILKASGYPAKKSDSVRMTFWQRARILAAVVVVGIGVSALIRFVAGLV